MATSTVKHETQQAARPVVMQAVAKSVVACGDCAYHIPHASRPGGWCGCKGSKQRWQPVGAAQRACEDFATWPEGSAVPAFLDAMRF